MNSSPQETEAWNAFLQARSQRDNLLTISHEFGSIECDNSVFDYPVSVGLHSLLIRAKELSDEFEKFQSEIDEFYQAAAWHYMAVAFDLRRGDQVQVTREGKTEILYCDSLWCEYADRAEFLVSGRIARKDGSEGKRPGFCHLAVEDWKIVGRSPENVLPLRQQ